MSNSLAAKPAIKWRGNSDIGYSSNTGNCRASVILHTVQNTELGWLASVNGTTYLNDAGLPYPDAHSAIKRAEEVILKTVEKRFRDLRPFIVTAEDALQAIADLPTPADVSEMNGQETAYRAIEQLLAETPHIHVNADKTSVGPNGFFFGTEDTKCDVKIHIEDGIWACRNSKKSAA